MFSYDETYEIICHTLGDVIDVLEFFERKCIQAKDFLKLDICDSTIERDFDYMILGENQHV